MGAPKETWEYAERMRRQAREEKQIRDIQAQDEAQGKMFPYYSGLDSSFGTGGTSITFCGIQDSVRQSPTITPALIGGYYPDEQEEIKALEDRIRQLEAVVSEQNEIIEALAADLTDIDILREENARLRIISALKSKPEIEIKPGYWLAHTHTPVGKYPPGVHASTKVRVKLRDYPHSGIIHEAREITWSRIAGRDDAEVVLYMIEPLVIES